MFSKLYILEIKDNKTSPLSYLELDLIETYSYIWIYFSFKDIFTLELDFPSSIFICLVRLDFRSKILIHLDFTVAQRYTFTSISLLLKDIHLLGKLYILN
ncbi:unnamed protein product [Adineta steineri]|uniref:Uncharacterized protein n=1 Tax=Adineta steineri TaxID=433720 RepID=A0A820C4S8_9BILA|nr:unnamed protein product [Adineta steineri]